MDQTAICLHIYRDAATTASSTYYIDNLLIINTFTNKNQIV